MEASPGSSASRPAAIALAEWKPAWLEMKPITSADAE